MESAPNSTKIAVIGECLLELSGSEFGTLHQSFGGDTLNTALYLARLMHSAATVTYATVLGTDSLSSEMLRRWQVEGIDGELTLRDAARLPGVYQIQLDRQGERHFLYWRQESAARYLLRHPEFDRVSRALSEVDLIYLSGISLAILPADDRARLIELLSSLAKRRIPIAFDTNYRDSLWSSPAAARDSMTDLLPAMRLLFTTFEDERRLWGDDTPYSTHSRYRAAHIESVIVKLGAQGCLYSHGDETMSAASAPVPAVVDTTAAGDSFNAGFLAAWLLGRTPGECCRAGNALAGFVIQHRGAIMPASATPTIRELLRNRESGRPLT